MDPTKLEAITPMETPPEVLKAMKELINDGQNDVARLPEHLFVSNLLPVLTDTSGEADVSIWLDIAGTGFRPIDVYNAAGETLFRVPAFYAQIPTQTIVDSRHSLATVVEHALQRSNQHPAIGATFLHSQLSQRQVEGNVNLALVREWNAILERYGHPPVVKLPDDPQTATAQAEASVSSGSLLLSDSQDDF